MRKVSASRIKGKIAKAKTFAKKSESKVKSTLVKAGVPSSVVDKHATMIKKAIRKKAKGAVRKAVKC